MPSARPPAGRAQSHRTRSRGSLAGDNIMRINIIKMRIIPNTAEAARYCDTLVSTSALASTVLGAALVGVDRGRVKLRELVERRRSRPVVSGAARSHCFRSVPRASPLRRRVEYHLGVPARHPGVPGDD